MPAELSAAILTSERFRPCVRRQRHALHRLLPPALCADALADPSQFIKAAWIRPEDLATYAAMGYTTFKLLERGIPSAELLRRGKAYSERRFDGNLAGLLLSYGFKEPVR
jgi:hypothetical protein